MKQHSEDSEVVLSTGQHMSPPPMARPKSSLGTIVVDMGSRGDVDLRLKSNGAMGVDMYSPSKKSSRPEPVSRIHCIPILMVFVFFILWAGSSEVVVEVKSKADSTSEMFVMRTPTPNKFATAEELKVSNKEISVHETGTALNEVSSHSNRASYSLEDRSKNSRGEKVYMRGTVR